MLLFRSEEHVDRWCSRNGLPKGAMLSLDQAWRLALAWYGEDRRLPGWRRRTVDESQALFAELGLTSDFWRLQA